MNMRQFVTSLNLSIMSLLHIQNTSICTIIRNKDMTLEKQIDFYIEIMFRKRHTNCKILIKDILMYYYYIVMVYL